MDSVDPFSEPGENLWPCTAFHLVYIKVYSVGDLPFVQAPYGLTTPLVNAFQCFGTYYVLNAEHVFQHSLHWLSRSMWGLQKRCVSSTFLCVPCVAVHIHWTRVPRTGTRFMTPLGPGTRAQGWNRPMTPLRSGTWVQGPFFPVCVMCAYTSLD